MIAGPLGTRRELLASTLALPAAGRPQGCLYRGRSTALLEPGLIYLNTASLGPSPPDVLDTVVAAWRELELNPVRKAYGRDEGFRDRADGIRAKAAALLGCSADEILFTHGTTSGMNTLAQGLRLQAGDRVLTTDREHRGGSAGWEYLARRDGVGIDRVVIPPDDFDVDGIVARFAAAITPRTRVISVSHVITSNGLRMPVAALSGLARRHGIICVVDGAQAVGGIAVDVKALGCHAYATSGHKWLLGPKGTGLLYVSADAPPSLLPVEWEFGRDLIAESAGIAAMPLAFGLGTAIDAAMSRGIAATERRIVALRDRAFAGLRGIPELRLVSPPPGPLATPMVAVTIPGRLDARTLIGRLRDRHKVIVKYAEARWFNGIRLSPHHFNTEHEIDTALAAIRAELA